VSGRLVTNPIESTATTLSPQTPRGVVVDLATVDTLGLFKTYFWLASPTQSLCGENVLDFTQRRSFVHFSMYSSTEPMPIENVPTDPEVMVVIEWLVFSECGMGGCADVQVQ
jgi:hypothetical protein